MTQRLRLSLPLGLLGLALLLSEVPIPAAAAQRASSTPAAGPPSIDAGKLRQLEQAQKQAVARWPPRQPSGAERKAEFEKARAQILGQWKSKLEANNTRLRAKFQASSGPARVTGFGPTPTPDSCVAPKINSIDAFNNTVAAGVELIVNGCGFGLKHPQSELRLMGNFPGGYMKLEVVQWHGDAIQAKVPVVAEENAVSQPAGLLVARKDLKLSNQWPVQFQPWDVQILPPEAVHVGCPQAPFINCHAAQSGSLAALAGTASTIGGTFGPFSDDQICTEASVGGSLKNSWVFAGLAWWWWYEKGTHGWTETPSGLQPWASSLNMNIRFCAGNGSVVAYKVDLYAMGPKGLKPY